MAIETIVQPQPFADVMRDLFRPFSAAVAAAGERPAANATRAAPYPPLDSGARALRFDAAVVRSSREERWVSLDGEATEVG